MEAGEALTEVDMEAAVGKSDREHISR